ncbi:(2Fe-2S)-binding protein [Streptomyces armeniacus]|uniref:(2Fe-2S)-binding protein n=1 Tax=Streptomyces armeniacus TaxID=83291 RepID=A0A345XWT0_9ACTN|nr:(2Fe-2S)-binding protein [Streptomyces armeniacus]AXK36096.1 (2Fe-2S)-binding protein [Streptomyces armeniacus]
MNGNGNGSLLRVRVDGEERHAFPGQTVAGLLLAEGRVSWRTTRGEGRPRGVFCGIGVCFDCLVVVNGVPDVRACRRLLAEGDEVRTQHGAELPS